MRRKLELRKILSFDNATISELWLDGMFFSYALEDAVRNQKIHGRTAIPAGQYVVKYRETESPMTMKYRERFNWFNWHMELQHVPNFKHIYIHIGNDEHDTDGCILVGDVWNGDDKIYESTNAFKRLYESLEMDLSCGDDGVVIIIDRM